MPSFKNMVQFLIEMQDGRLKEPFQSWVLLKQYEMCFHLVDLDLSNCHVLDTRNFGVLSMIKHPDKQQADLFLGNGP